MELESSDSTGSEDSFSNTTNTTNTSPLSTGSTLLESFLSKNPQIQYIRYQWLDMSGVLRARCLHKSHALKLSHTNQPLRCGPITLQGLADNSVFPDLPRSGVHELHPDWSSLRTLGISTTFAGVMCNIVEVLPHNSNRPDASRCPRQALSNIINTAAQQYGLHFLVGFEIELVILKENTSKRIENDPPCVPLGTGPGRYCVASMRDLPFQLLEKCVAELVNSGVKIQDFHVEGYRGQYEISLAPLPPLTAVDELVRVHDMIKSTVAGHGYIATVTPKPPKLEQGSGEHIHISISPSSHEDAFLAGMLHNLPGIYAITMPFAQSYARIGKLEAGEQANWGTENRDVAVRKIKSGHWEVRGADATANMYLAIAAILAAGVLGIQSQRPLRFPDVSFARDTDPEDPPSELPQSLGDVLQLLKASSKDLSHLLPKDLLDHYVAVKEVESARMAELSEEEVDKIMVTLF